MLLVGMTAMAQRTEGKQGKGQRDSMKDFTPEQMATLRAKKMTLTLDLSTAQQSSVKALILKNATTRKAKMEERRAKRKEGDAKKLTSDERFTMQNAMLDNKIAQKVAMKKILSDDQYSKWEKMEMGRHHKKSKAEKKKGSKKNGRSQQGK